METTFIVEQSSPTSMKLKVKQQPTLPNSKTKPNSKSQQPIIIAKPKSKSKTLPIPKPKTKSKTLKLKIKKHSLPTKRVKRFQRLPLVVKPQPMSQLMDQQVVFRMTGNNGFNVNAHEIATQQKKIEQQELVRTLRQELQKKYFTHQRI